MIGHHYFLALGKGYKKELIKNGKLRMAARDSIRHLNLLLLAAPSWIDGWLLTGTLSHGNLLLRLLKAFGVVPGWQISARSRFCYHCGA